MALPYANSHPSLHATFPDPKLAPWPQSFLSQLPNALHPKKLRHRTTLISLVFFAFVTTYVLLAHGSALSPTYALRRAESPAADQLAIALESTENARAGDAALPLSPNRRPDASHRGKGHRHRPLAPPLTLSPAEELAAISSFIAALPQNVLPPTVDPAQPIDPQLVLDFDTRRIGAAAEVRVMVDDVWTRNPVFLYSKFYSPESRELKALLADLRLFPAATVVDVDMRDDADVLKPVLARLTGAPALPVLLVGGEYVGTVDAVREMAADGRLQDLITLAGAKIDGQKKKGGRKH